jgi:hypothetical protein
MTMPRNVRQGLVHKGAKQLLGLSDTSGGDDRRQYEDWLEQQTGQRSCRLLDMEELSRLVDYLRAVGALDDPRTRGAQGADRPTERQLAAIAALARGRGWDGLDDLRLQRWIYRTAKVAHVRFLTRRLASDCITGLERWEAQAHAAVVRQVDAAEAERSYKRAASGRRPHG